MRGLPRAGMPRLLSGAVGDWGGTLLSSPAEQERGECEGKGSQASNTVTVSPTWVPFPSRRYAAFGRG